MAIIFRPIHKLWPTFHNLVSYPNKPKQESRKLHIKRVGIKLNVMNIKFLVLILYTLIWNQQLFSQCDLTITDDGLSSKAVVSTKDVTLAKVFPVLKSGDAWNLYVRLYSTDSAICLILTHESATDFDYIDQFYFILENGTSISKTNRINQKLFHQGPYYSCFSTFPFTKDELLNLSKNKVVKFKVYFSNFPEFPTYEKDLKGKKSESLQEIAKCLIEKVK